VFFMCQGWVIDNLFGVLQLLQHIAAQGMGDVGGMHGAFPPNIPPQLAGLMQVCHPYHPAFPSATTFSTVTKHFLAHCLPGSPEHSSVALSCV
jgi:hypothetical protein